MIHGRSQRHIEDSHNTTLNIESHTKSSKILRSTPHIRKSDANVPRMLQMFLNPATATNGEPNGEHVQDIICGVLVSSSSFLGLLDVCTP